MRFPLSAIFFVIASFIFFIIYAVMSLVMTEVDSALTPYISGMSSAAQANMTSTLTIVQYGFGIFAALFFLAGILLIFFVDSWRDDPEYYYRR